MNFSYIVVAIALMAVFSACATSVAEAFQRARISKMELLKEEYKLRVAKAAEQQREDEDDEDDDFRPKMSHKTRRKQ